MGQNVYGMQKGVAAAMDELNRHTGNARKKYTTEEDYYQAFVAGGSLTAGRRCQPTDPLRLRLWKRAHARYEAELNAEKYKYNTVDEMVNALHERGRSYTNMLRNSTKSSNVKRQEMIETAIARYFEETRKELNELDKK